MLKRFWGWFIQVPPGVDMGDKFDLRVQYLMCFIIALNGPLFLVAAVTGNISVLVRFALIGAAIVTVASALALRVLIFWIYDKKMQLFRHLHLE